MNESKPSQKPWYRWPFQREFVYDVMKSVASAYAVILTGLLLVTLSGIEFDPYTTPLLAYFFFLLAAIGAVAVTVPILSVLTLRTFRPGKHRVRLPSWMEVRYPPWMKWVFLVMLITVVGTLIALFVELVQFNNEFS